MNFSLRLLAVLLALAWTPFAFAQSTDSEAGTTEQSSDAETEAETEAEAPEQSTERADGLVVGQEANEDKVGATYVKETHGDWELRCINAGEEQQDPCELFQLLDDENGNATAEVRIFGLPEGDKLAAGGNIIVPLETLLLRDLQISVDGGKPKVYRFFTCTQIGCLARIGFTDGDIAAFKAGAGAEVRIAPARAPDQVVALKMSLTGFTAGFKAVQENAPAPAQQ